MARKRGLFQYLFEPDSLIFSMLFCLSKSYIFGPKKGNFRFKRHLYREHNSYKIEITKIGRLRSYGIAQNNLINPNLTGGVTYPKTFNLGSLYRCLGQ